MTSDHLATTLLTPHTWRALRAIVLASVVLNIFGLAAPVASMVIFNKVLPHQATATLTVVAIGMVIVYAFDAALRTARNLIAVYTGARLDAAIGQRVVQHLLRLPIGYFERTPMGETVERLRQLDTVRSFVTGELPLVIVDLGFSVVGLAVLLAIDWRMGAIAAGMLPMFVPVSYLADLAQRDQSEASFRAATAKGMALQEIIGSALTVKAMGLQAPMQARYGERLTDSAWASFKTQNLAGLSLSVSNLLHGLTSLAVLVLGAHLIIDGSLTVGALIASSLLVGRILAPARYLATAWHRLREARQAFARLEGLMHEAPEVELASTLDVAITRVPLRCEGVQFTHDGQQRPVLAGADLTLLPGTITALVGASGSGKTTLGKVAAGLYAASGGRVTVGEVDIRQASAASLRAMLGYVPQDAQLFAGTVLENILVGIEGDARRRALEAAQFTGAHALIQNLPQGYGTKVGDGGVALSAGQRQLVALTRVIVRNPRVLILDEVTSALDPGAEAHLMRNLQRATKAAGLTVLIITHRATTLPACDRVALLADGRIVRDGPPDVMMPVLLPRARAERKSAEAAQ